MANILIDTYKLVYYAQRLSDVNRKVNRLEGRIDSLYDKTGLFGLWNLKRENPLTCHKQKLSHCADYLENTAEDFVRTELEIDYSAYASSKPSGFQFSLYTLVHSILPGSDFYKWIKRIWNEIFEDELKEIIDKILNRDVEANTDTETNPQKEENEKTEKVPQKEPVSPNKEDTTNRKPDTEEMTYEQKVKYIDSKNPTTEAQSQRIKNTDSGYKKMDGLCNVCSLISLLNRRYALDSNGDSEFTYKEVFKGNGIENYKSVDNWRGTGSTGYEYNGSTSSAFNNRTYTSLDGKSYTTHVETASTVKNNMIEMGTDDYNRYVVELLKKHPEGICLRNASAKHWAVITHYEIVDGKIQLYVYDPVNSYSDPLEGSYLWRNSPSNNIYNNLDSIGYLN